MKTPGQIVALGGGMFSMEADNGLLDKYILNLVPKEKPKICFFGTASNDGTEYREMFYNFFNKLNCEPSHLSFLDPPYDIEKFILDKDIIHVGGGNTSLIIETWKKTGVDKIMKKAYRSGVILTGMSAGAICWFQDGITNPSPGVLTRLPCLGLLEGSFCPHYDDKVELKKSFHKLILEGTIGNGVGAEDGAAVHYLGNKILRVVTSRPDVTAYSVKKVRNKIVETPFVPFYLGKQSDTEHTMRNLPSEILDTVISYVNKINHHDIDGLAEFMSDDHIFIDSLGMVIKGKKEMINAWKIFLKWFPNYEIQVSNTLLTDDTVGLFGFAVGTFDSEDPVHHDKFKIPAAWRAKVRDNRVTEWQAIADNEAVRDIIKGNGVKSMFRAKLKSKSH
ncbi:MAG: Type 1 glutamine amidotransferase-like domain-containing protein [Ignavibacteria bacterium]|nr:Type 1 glutamine amidotransferase-like domain-containing protein [Ignavibacteria bacterium]